MSLRKILDEGREATKGNPEAQALFERFFERASRDPVTGVLTRQYFDEMPEEERRTNGKNGLGLIMVDVDHFKDYNDTHGHPQGDLALRAVAQSISDQLRGADVVRYGGEEFLVLAYGASLDQTREVAERIRSAVEVTEIPGDFTEKPGYETVTVTAGISALGRDEHDLLGEKICDADQNLYAGKNEGRNQVYG